MLRFLLPVILACLVGVYHSVDPTYGNMLLGRMCEQVPKGGGEDVIGDVFVVYVGECGMVGGTAVCGATGLLLLLPLLKPVPFFYRPLESHGSWFLEYHGLWQLAHSLTHSRTR